MSHVQKFGLIALAVFVTTAAADDTPSFKIKTKRENDTVEVRADKDKTVFIVKGPFGISQAVIKRTDEKWPDTIMFRLHLKGLEKFGVTNGKVMVEASVSSQDGKVRLWKHGNEHTPLDAKSPYWMEIRIVGGDGKLAKAIPLKDGYFEMALPKAFFDGNPKSIILDWIDFYR